MKGKIGAPEVKGDPVGCSLFPDKSREGRMCIMKVLSKTIIVGFACLACSISPLWADTRYVDINNATPSAPYTSWETAANSIHDAGNAAVSNDTVLVTNGTYRITQQISVRKSLVVRSVNGPEVTIVDASVVDPLVDYQFNDSVGTNWRFLDQTGTDTGQWKWNVAEARADGAGYAHLTALTKDWYCPHFLATPISSGRVMMEFRLPVGIRVPLLTTGELDLFWAAR